MHVRRHRLLPALVVAVVGVPLAASGAQPTAPSPDRVVGHLRAGAPGQWSPLHPATGSLAIALADGSAALVSVGGDHDATVFDQRLGVDGSLGPRTEVTSVDDVEDCRVVDAATAVSNLAVAVECRVRTDTEEPPTRLVQLVWTGDDGWVWKVRPEGEIGSVDYSPQGQYALFASNSGYGRPHHLTSYHPDLGWRDLTRPVARGNSGADMIGAINDSGSVLTVRGGGYEEEPGSWYDGRLRIDGYNARTEQWTIKHSRRRQSGGFTARAVDVSGGRFVATVVESRSTGELYGRAYRVLVLSGRPSAPRSWTPRWTYGVAAGRAAMTASGVGVVAWQAAGKPVPVDEPLGASPVSQLRSWVATWAPSRGRPTARRLAGTTTAGDAAWFDRSLDLSVGGDGRGVVAHAQHERDATDWAVTARSFTVGPRGGLRGATEQTWRLPKDPTIDVVAGSGNTSITLGSLVGPGYPAPDVQYAVRAPDATPRR
ncbi:hypothetical protein SAMN04489844_2794 [Nocardioides exalbidus]|uniref:WD40-like Beta Propeller Repeat n=1 Tax=Nocardioides exalbidus TaxID=402596 RepID=A0A1H4UML5_9ACTN|nr:hypothetical protein [Nocardioides exalbidus]SEC69344.1 hypothetical protein SAMN04489844_2794 [Nocardioides exalbidus]